MHIKRNAMPRTWPMPRKGTKNIIVPRHNKKIGIPLIVLLRDMLKVAKTRSEVKAILTAEKVKINNKIVKDEKFGLVLFDILDVNGKNYKLILNNKKFRLEETKEHEKIAKIIGKKILKGKKVQVNLNDGRNFLAKENVKVGDSAVISLTDGKVAKILPLKAGAKIIVIEGSHIGEEGKIENLDENGEAEIKLEKEKVKLNIRYIMAI